MVIFEDMTGFNRIMDLAKKDNIVSSEIIDRVHQFCYWIFERYPLYLDLLTETSFTHFEDKLIIDWNKDNHYVSVEFTSNLVQAYIKTPTENVSPYHSITLKVVDDVVHYIAEIGL